MSRLRVVGMLACGVGLAVGCRDRDRIALEESRLEIEELARAAREDVEAVRAGMPHGAKMLVELLPADPARDVEAVRGALERVRARRVDLSGAKSTFFALTDPAGTVLRSDRELDMLAGKSLFEPFPALKQALGEGCVEARGSMTELAGVKGRDAQWVLACPVRSGEVVRGVYATGWSWSSYAYRLENKARTDAREKARAGARNTPLIYAFVLVGSDVFGAPLAPEVNRELVRGLDLPARLAPGVTHAEIRESTGRNFAVAARRVPELGDDVLVALLWSEN